MNPVEILKTELNVEPIRADGVFFLEVENKIIHLEFQTTPKSDPPLSLRMLDYWVRLYRIYKQKKEIEQVIIFLERSNSKEVYEDNFQLGKTTHYYRVIRIWECEATPLLRQPELLPLAVLAKTEQPELLLSQVAKRIDKIKDTRVQSNIAACVGLLASINYSEELIAMYLQEDLLEKTPLYQKILNKGVKKGVKQGVKKGVKQGVQQGVQQEALTLISRLLKKRFGDISKTIKPQISTLSIEQLESLAENLLDFNSFDDVIIWLNNLNV